MTNQENERRFFKMLALCPELEKFWDVNEGVCKQRSLGLAVSSYRLPDNELALLKFFSAVWFGNVEVFGFDFVENIKAMSKREVMIVRKWLLDPFFCGDWAE